MNIVSFGRQATRLFFAFILVCLLFLNSNPVPAAQAQTSPVWRPVWSDEFNGYSVNTNDWIFEVGGGWGNHEMQCYTNGNDASIQDDQSNRALVIEARQENVGGCPYTSTRMTTKAKREFKYGK